MIKGVCVISCRRVVRALLLSLHSLSSLTGLESITSVGEDLFIYGNASLTSLTGLESLASVGDDFTTTNNPDLPASEAESLAYDQIGEENIGGTITIERNGPG